MPSSISTLFKITCLCSLISVLSSCSISLNVAGNNSSYQTTALKTAQKNLKTNKGAYYNWTLGVYFDSQYEIYQGKQQCVEQHPAPHKVDGYIYFDINRDYQLRLSSDSAFAQCIKALYQNRLPPHPPRSPYYQVFALDLEEPNTP